MVSSVGEEPRCRGDAPRWATHHSLKKIFAFALAARLGGLLALCRAGAILSLVGHFVCWATDSCPGKRRAKRSATSNCEVYWENHAGVGDSGEAVQVVGKAARENYVNFSNSSPSSPVFFFAFSVGAEISLFRYLLSSFILLSTAVFPNISLLLYYQRARSAWSWLT